MQMCKSTDINTREGTYLNILIIFCDNICFKYFRIFNEIKIFLGMIYKQMVKSQLIERHFTTVLLWLDYYPPKDTFTHCFIIFY